MKKINNGNSCFLPHRLLRAIGWRAIIVIDWCNDEQLVIEKIFNILTDTIEVK